MKSIIVALLLQSFPMVPRTGLENPAAVSPVPKKLQKDYDKIWTRFVKGKEDAKIIKDVDKKLKKNPGLTPLVIIQAYVDLYNNRSQDAEAKLERALAVEPDHRVALSYLAEFAFDRRDYVKASDLYSRLMESDPRRTDVETKRQKALLLATENLIRRASEAELANRPDEAESFYNRALQVAPREPSLHGRLGELLGKQKKWEQALAEFRKEREFGGIAEDADRRIAEALANLGRTEEAREIVERLKTSGTGDTALEQKVNELEDIGRWGRDIAAFRKIEASSEISREQLAAMLVRYFPQLTEFRRTPQVITDLQDTWARPEIQTVAGIGLMEPLPNHTFQPAAPITRGELGAALARLTRLLRVPALTAPPILTVDLRPGHALYREIQVVLNHGLMTVDDAGAFDAGGKVPGETGVVAVERLLELTREK